MHFFASGRFKIMTAILGVSAFGLVACNTPLHRDLPRVHSGMEKDQVLDLLGGPKLSERQHGVDRWTYVYYVDQQRQGTRVDFKYGKVIEIEPVAFAPSLREQLKSAEDMHEYRRLAREIQQQETKDFKELKP